MPGSRDGDPAAFGCPERALSFDLLETLLFTPAGGYFLLAGHLARLRRSAACFGFPDPQAAVREALAACSAGRTSGAWRVRVLWSREGRVRTQVSPQVGAVAPVTFALARTPVAASDPFLHHKTTHRDVYARARADMPDGCDEVLLVNERGEATEFTVGNLVAVGGGRFLTPPLHCGLLDGTFRKRLLAAGRIREAVLRPEDLHAAERLYLINSVRGWVRAVLPDRPGQVRTGGR